MRTLRFLLQKEFRQIFRDSGILRIIFILPVIQLLILPWAADYEIKNIKLAVVDHDHNSEVRLTWIQFPRFNPETNIEVVSSNWFNPLMNYKFFMVPGILVLLLTMVGSNLTAINIVKEKEIGTIEQINVTPIKKYHFVLGKLIPFWALGLLVFSIGFTIAWLVYGIVPAGSLLTIYFFAAIYLLPVLGL